MSKIDLVIVDLDNTIYNWVDYHVPALEALLNELQEITDIERKELKRSFKQVHENRRTSEYAFVLQELDVLLNGRETISENKVIEEYGSAVEAFRSTRDEKLRLYEGVKETLHELDREGRSLVAYTDALFYYAIQRVQDLNIEDAFDGIAAPKSHASPTGTTTDHLRSREFKNIKTTIPYVDKFEMSQLKPNSGPLVEVINAFEANRDDTLYVGDSLHKDISMAQSCGIHDVYAEYGTDFDPENYELLVDVSHWTDEEVQKAKSFSEKDVMPSFTIHSFPEIMKIIDSLENAELRNDF